MTIDLLENTLPIDERAPSASIGDRPLHIAIVDEEFPYPLNSGKRIRTLNLLLPLAKRHRITYLAYRNSVPGETEIAREYLHAHGINTHVVEGVRPTSGSVRFYGRLLGNLFSKLPYSVETHNTPALRQAIAKYDAAHDVDLWQCEWSPYAQSVLGNVRSSCVVMAHNVESLIWQRYHENDSQPLRRWYIGHQWKKFRRFERRVFASADRLVFVSSADAQLARDKFCGERTAVVDNGVDVKRYRTDGRSRDQKTILFLGSLDWRPNQLAVEQLLDHIFPLVLQREPSARLLIVGRKPSASLKKQINACPNVELHADVPDVRPFLWEVGAMVVPLRIGGGSRLKILEAMAASCPVVSTLVGAEGLRVLPGKHFVLADEPTEMAHALVSAIQKPDLLADLAASALNVVQQEYDWRRLSEMLETVWIEEARVTAGKH